MTAEVEIRPGSDADLDPLVAALENADARRLDERLGYVDWDHGTIVGTWVERDHDGPPVILSETCHVLVKRL